MLTERRIAVVVEDDADIRGLLEVVLQQSGFDVHSTDSGVAGVELVESHHPDLVTLDIGLPDIDGFETARRIRSVSDAHILMLTARSDEIDTVLGLESGADEYVTKPFRPRELRARVDAIMRRRTSLGGTANGATPGESRPAALAQDEAATDEAHLRSLNGLVVNVATYSVHVDGEAKVVTPTEFTLLESLLGAKGHIRTKTDLVRRLRNEDSDAGTYVSASDERSVEVHVGNLRRKLGDSAQEPRWIETVRGVGYRAVARR
ncbi:response regulator transcription factor [Paeniglutamicibacter psychrophenolicus]